MKKFGPYLIFLAAMLWATDAPFRVHLTKELSSNFIVLVEHFFDVIVVLPILWLMRGEFKKLNWKSWIAVLVIAIGGSALASIAFTQAFKFVNPSVAILLQKLQPLIAISLAAGLLKERLGKYFWLWTVVALAGAYVISFPSFVPRLFIDEQFNPNTTGVLLAVLAAVLWGASTVFGKFVLNKVDFKVMTGLRFVLAFLFLLVLNFSQKTIPSFSVVTGKDWLYLAIIAVTSGVVSLFIYYKGLQVTRASIATLAELGFPMAAVLINFIFLKETLVPMQLVGMTVLLFAVFQLNRVNSKLEPVLVE
jgi:drug/metabolite transporter (DMT)-like permease